MITARISKYSTVTFETNKYSVPERYPGRTAMIKIFADRIELIANDEVVATHRRIYGRKQYSLDICHYLETFEYKPGSLANARVFKRLLPRSSSSIMTTISITLESFSPFSACSKSTLPGISLLRSRFSPPGGCSQPEIWSTAS